MKSISCDVAAYRVGKVYRRFGGTLKFEDRKQNKKRTTGKALLSEDTFISNA
jgi:hypothetical protein